MYRVTKRDGSITEFHIAKIGNAITKAFEAVGRNIRSWPALLVEAKASSL